MSSRSSSKAKTVFPHVATAMPGRYVPATGSRLSLAEAERYGTALTTLAEEHGGQLSPEAIVAAAAKPRTTATKVLHEWFEWEAERAASQWRVEQAKYLLRSIQFVAIVDGKEQSPVHAFYNVSPPELAEEERTTAYVSVDTLLNDDVLRAQYVERLRREALQWLARAAMYEKEFPDICEAIRREAEKWNK